MKLLIPFLIFLSTISAKEVLTTPYGEYDSLKSGSRLSQPLSIPQSIAFDKDGRLFIVDSGNNKIRVLDKDGFIKVVVGSNYEGDSDGDPLKSSLKIPMDITFDNNNNLIISDTYNHKIKKIINNKLVTIAGTGDRKYNGDGIGKNISFPKDISIYNDELYFIDFGNSLLRKIDKDGKIITILGAGDKYFDIDKKIAPKDLKLKHPRAFKFDKEGNIYIADNNGTFILFIDIKNNIVKHFAGTGKVELHLPIKEGWHPTETHIGIINSIFIDKNQKIYLVSSTHNAILKTDGLRVKIYAGDGNFKAYYKVGPPEKSSFNYPTDFLIHNGVGYIVDKRNNFIRKVEKNIVSIYVGYWDDKNHLDKLYYPNSIVNDNNFFYIADTLNYRVVQTDLDFSKKEIVAGTGYPGFFGKNDEKMAKDINLDFISDLAVCNHTLYLADPYNHRVWKIDNKTLTFNKVYESETGGVLIDIECYKDGLIILDKKGKKLIYKDGENINILKNLANYIPQKIKVSGDKIFFSDQKNRSLYSLKNGNEIERVCGGGDQKTFDKKIECNKIDFISPYAIEYNSKNSDIYLSDIKKSIVYKIKDGFVEIIAGDGKRGYNKKEGLAQNVSLYEPSNLLFFNDNLYIVDSINNLIRKVEFVKKRVIKRERIDKDSNCSIISNNNNYYELFLLIILILSLLLKRFYKFN